VRGVALASGEEIAALSLPATSIPSARFFQWIAGSIGFSTASASSARRNVAQNESALSGLPEFTALAGAPGPQHQATMHICPSIEYVERAWDDAKYGRPSRSPLIEMTIPTMYDPTLAPEGRHIMGIFLQYAPYTLKESDWDAEREPYAERVLDVIEEYCPNIRRLWLAADADAARPRAPLRLTGGNIFMAKRRSIRCSRAAPAGRLGPLSTAHALYLCGAGAQPGGG
jgi:phytoene dehydrogenase-like protein